jgi:nickel/cobalt exporter
MLLADAVGLFIGAIALGAVHGIEPGHGWPIAASYALDRSNKWLAGLAAGLVLGVGHLVSSIAMVGVFFFATTYFDLTQVNAPIRVFGVAIGGPVSIVAGIVLIALGVREYTHGHGHSHGGEHGHEHRHGDHDGHHHHSDAHDHSHAHDNHDHAHTSPVETADRGLLGLAWFAFLLGFAHEEEFEIIALCAGSTYCLELMSVYALAVVVGIVGLTLLMVAGYEHFEEEVEQYAPYLPVLSAIVLVAMGVGFVFGLF